MWAKRYKGLNFTKALFKIEVVIKLDRYNVVTILKSVLKPLTFFFYFFICSGGTNIFFKKAIFLISIIIASKIKYVQDSPFVHLTLRQESNTGQKICNHMEATINSIAFRFEYKFNQIIVQQFLMENNLFLLK